MFSKGAPESIITRCTHILCNEDGSSIPLTTDIRNELDERFKRSAMWLLFLYYVMNIHINFWKVNILCYDFIAIDLFYCSS